MTNPFSTGGPPDNVEPIRRSNPLAWGNDTEAPSGVFIDDADSLQLIGTPAATAPATTPRLPSDFKPTGALIRLVDDVHAALRRAAQATADDARVIDLLTLSRADRHHAELLLLRGEVNGLVASGDITWQIQEAALTGVWLVRGETTDGSVVAHYIEISDVPGILRREAERMSGPMAALPHQLPAGVMNAPAVASEISARSESWRPQDGNHVINFTLLPMTEADQQLLQAMLGQIPVKLHSGGFGSCRIYATAVSRVWAVQFLSAMGHTILDTLEIGDVPDAAKATPSDFEDSAVRLQEIKEAYL